MDESRKKELFPYFAYIYSKEMNPEKYGQIESIEDWIKTIQESDEDAQQIITAAEQLTDEDWQNLDQQYSQEKASNETVLAAKGAKLKKLKKCKCGCDMITVKEKGGKMISKCACGCKSEIKKAEKGISIKVNSSENDLANKFLKKGGKPFDPKSVLPKAKIEKKGGCAPKRIQKQKTKK